MRTKKRNNRKKTSNRGGQQQGPISRGLYRHMNNTKYEDDPTWQRYSETSFNSNPSNEPEYLQPGTPEFNTTLKIQRQQRKDNFGYNNSGMMGIQQKPIVSSNPYKPFTPEEQESLGIKVLNSGDATDEQIFNAHVDEYKKKCNGYFNKYSSSCKQLKDKINNLNYAIGDYDCAPSIDDNLDTINSKINSCCPKTKWGFKNSSGPCIALYNKQKQLSSPTRKIFGFFGGKRTRRGNRKSRK